MLIEYFFIPHSIAKLKLSYQLQNIDGSVKRYFYKIRNELDLRRENNLSLLNVKRIARLYHIKSVLDNKKSVQFSFKPTRALKPVAIICFKIIFLLIPIVYYCFILIPTEIQELKLGSYTIGNHGFTDVHSFFWYINIKLCVLIPLCIWFVSNTKWWRYAILCPIILYSFELWEGIQEDIVLVDETAYLMALPYIIILILILFFLADNLKYKIKINDLYEEISSEIYLLLQASTRHTLGIKKIILELDALKIRKFKNEYSKENLECLIKLKEELLFEINSGR